ncbi:type II toxin-antitoxin system Phd/YefM family antitoxin [Subtercola endophyticus]|uniref:type II toxin-antitoxin system Phd/YefM family antitoxin n=1 Tax=Subtercola endophyticus TaxID=2895559 RepID=UPI001E40E8CC|nr:type II toxin-antitoxin system prevent-host-death family antitoxin [Subtercola endophyticus]UFS59055.1 type II toxin-antitoxin system prevent-host-death family antitoxin [Subtercola endophyticus]
MSKADIGLRELKQNASDVVSRAEAGTQFRVVRNGKPTNVVIALREPAKKRWVPASELADLFAGVEPDATGWLAENDRHRDDDPLVDPWKVA